MYLNMFFLFDLIYCLNITQHNGLLASLEVITEELKDAADLKITISDFKNVGYFENGILKYSHKNKSLYTLGTTDSTACIMVFNKWKDIFFMEFQFSKYRKLFTKQIVFERIKETNLFRICSPDKHLVILEKEFSDLIFSIEKKEICFKKILEDIKIQYNENQLIYDVLCTMHSNYKRMNEENTILNTVDEASKFTASPPNVPDRRKQLVKYLETCAQSVKRNNMSCNLKIPCFASKKRTVSLVCSVFNELYNSVSKRIFEKPRFNFFDLSKVKFDFVVKRCIVLNTQPENIEDRHDSFSDDFTDDEDDTRKTDQENTSVQIIDQSEVHTPVDIKGKSKEADCLKDIEHNIIGDFIYLQYCDLRKKNINDLRIYMKNHNSTEIIYSDFKFDFDKLNQHFDVYKIESNTLI